MNEESGRNQTIPNAAGRFRGRGVFRAGGTRSALRGRNRGGATRSEWEVKRRNTMPNKWNISEFKSKQTLQQEDNTPLAFNGFDGQTVFNYRDRNKITKEKIIRHRSNKNSHTETGDSGLTYPTRGTFHGSRSQGRGRGNFNSSKTAKLSEGDASGDKTEVYDFSHFSDKDFERRPNFRRGDISKRGRFTTRGKST